MMKIHKSTASLIALTSIGLLQFIGFLLQSPAIEGLGFISNASPLPLDFSHYKGREPFSDRYELETKYLDGVDKIQISYESYAAVGGPYNLRNVYVAMIAGAPALQEGKNKDLWKHMIQRSFCSEGLLSSTFGIESKIFSIQLNIYPRGQGLIPEFSKEIDCE